MVTVDLKGLHKVKSKGKVYYYAWRGGPALRGNPGSPEFMASLREAQESRITPDPEKFRTLVTLYKASPDYQKLADSTKRNWSTWLDRISDHFGDLLIANFDRPQMIRPRIRKWRGTFAETPRTADYGLQVLSRVLSYAVDPLGRISMNPCEGIRRVYSSERAAITWSDEDIANVKAVASQELSWAVDMAVATGLRAGDLVRLSWGHVKGDTIIISTGKSGHKRDAVIPIYAGLRDLLASIPKRSTTVLTSSRGTAWKVNGLNTVFYIAKVEAGLNKSNLHFHDLRGTAATRFYKAGLSERVIAEIMGWEEDYVAKIIRRYVSRTAATHEAIKMINEASNRT